MPTKKILINSLQNSTTKIGLKNILMCSNSMIKQKDMPKQKNH